MGPSCGSPPIKWSARRASRVAYLIAKILYSGSFSVIVILLHLHGLGIRTPRIDEGHVLLQPPLHCTHASPLEAWAVRGSWDRASWDHVARLRVCDPDRLRYARQHAPLAGASPRENHARPSRG